MRTTRLSIRDVHLQRRGRVRGWQLVAVPVASIAAALVVGAVFLALAGHVPTVVYPAMLRAAFVTWFGFTDTLASATPLVLTGLAAAVAFRFGLYNIGAEGQLYVGAIAASGVALALGDTVPAPAAVLGMLVAGVIGGMLWIAVPAAARAWLGTSEIITTLLLNYVALYWMRYLIFGSTSFWRDPTATNFPQGKPIPAPVELVEFGLTRVHLGLVVAVLAAAVVAVVLARTRLGYELRVYGDSPAAARYAGIDVRRTVLVVLLVSGALAGLAGASEIGGRAHQLDPQGLALGLGYAGIIVAALARYNPLAVVGVAVLLGGVRNAGTALQSLPGGRVPIAISTMLEGAILLFTLGGELFVRYRLRFHRGTGAAPEATAETAPVTSPAEPTTGGTGGL
ncbi:MAG: ABC transporter permease [Egibacteraceae bacterium]